MSDGTLSVFGEFERDFGDMKLTTLSITLGDVKLTLDKAQCEFLNKVLKGDCTNISYIYEGEYQAHKMVRGGSTEPDGDKFLDLLVKEER
jgi:hypothetical protein